MKPELKKLLVLNLPYLLFVYLFAKCGQAYRLAAGVDASAKLLHLTDGISAAFANPLPSLHLFDLCVGVVGAVAVRLIVYSKGKNAKKYRKGEEYGSARWGTAKDIAPYIDPKFENNILLTQTERLTMTGRPKDPKTARNKNVLVIGGSGSGKTRFYVKPNLMQCFPTSDYPTSFVVTDPKGTLVLETGQMFQRAGYRVKILNTINFSKSMKYNPFVYIHSEKDVLKLVNTLIANTKGEGEKSAEDFWVKSERLFYTALIGYIWYEAPAEEMNFITLLEMINASEAREDDPDFQSPVDLMFERLEQKDPDHFAVRQYKKFLLSAGKTRSSILISCGARLAPFDIREVRELMENDEMELDTIGDEKTVLFLIMSDTDTTFNFILAMLQSQLINLLCDSADDKYGGRLPVHVRLILDEFANIGQIPNFDKLIATIRSREISASIILQSQSQLKAMQIRYRTKMMVIIGPYGVPQVITYQEPYEYYICTVKLKNKDLSHLPVEVLTEEQLSAYSLYMRTLGNRPDLFGKAQYPNASTIKQPTYYDIPPEALKDDRFAAMMEEATKYIGYPYVWGGSSPSTSFDCSGYISWVLNHSGWNVGRQTAQGLYNLCTPVSTAQVKPGDLVFFKGTYDTPGVSHCGIYVGNSIMLHCGDPISYTNLNSKYWQEHFYSYGRLP